MMKVSEEGKVPHPRDWKRYTKTKHEHLRHRFDTALSIKCNWSQSFQDIFVLSMLNGKSNGYYVEIGADQPRIYNNTYLLEKDYKWTGVSLEFDADKVEFFNSMRRNKCICHDAMTYDYVNLFRERNYPKQIDYLSLDIEPATHTLEALKRMPVDYRFSVITFETDIYQTIKAPPGPLRKKHQVEDVTGEARYILRTLGYELFVPNVAHNDNPYEDWWIDPNFVDPTIVQSYRDGINQKSIITPYWGTADDSFLYLNADKVMFVEDGLTPF